MSLALTMSVNAMFSTGRARSAKSVCGEMFGVAGLLQARFCQRVSLNFSIAVIAREKQHQKCNGVGKLP